MQDWQLDGSYSELQTDERFLGWLSARQMKLGSAYLDLACPSIAAYVPLIRVLQGTRSLGLKGSMEEDKQGIIRVNIITLRSQLIPNGQML